METKNTDGLYFWGFKWYVWDKKQIKCFINVKNTTWIRRGGNERIFQVCETGNENTCKVIAEKDSEIKHQEEDDKVFEGNKRIFDRTEEEDLKTEWDC